MKFFAFCLILLVSVSTYAQSKKELVAQVNALKAEISASKAEIEELKKPKEVVVDLSNENKKASYGIGVIVASNVMKQGGDSLSLDAMTAAIKDVFQNKTLKIEQQECMTIVQQYMHLAGQSGNSIFRKDQCCSEHI